MVKCPSSVAADDNGVVVAVAVAAGDSCPSTDILTVAS
jgi:hypothetical protein